MGAPKWPPSPQTLGAPRRSRGAPRERLMARPFVIVFVVDGLRPDAITAEDTPTLFRLRTEGVEFTNSHSVFPTVTRVNAATIATGMQPGTHGIVGNQIYAPTVDPRRAFNTGNVRNLRALEGTSGGRLLMGPTLG